MDSTAATTVAAAAAAGAATPEQDELGAKIYQCRRDLTAAGVFAVRNGGSLSYDWRSRVKRSVDYLMAHPDAPRLWCIVERSKLRHLRANDPETGKIVSAIAPLPLMMALVTAAAPPKARAFMYIPFPYEAPLRPGDEYVDIAIGEGHKEDRNPDVTVFPDARTSLDSVFVAPLPADLLPLFKGTLIARTAPWFCARGWAEIERRLQWDIETDEFLYADASGAVEGTIAHALTQCNDAFTDDVDDALRREFINVLSVDTLSEWMQPLCDGERDTPAARPARSVAEWMRAFIARTRV